MISVDVIVPCYKYGHFLRECVESVLNQEGASVRVLIIDDASPDNSAQVGRELSASDARVTFLEHDRNRGHIATYNEGIEWVSAKYMLLISADDYLLPGALQRATAVMEANSDVGFVFGAAKELYDDGKMRAMHSNVFDVGENWRVMEGSEFISRCGATNIVPTPTAVVRTDLLKQSGGYRPDLPHTADMEMWWRFAAQASVGVVRECQAVYRRHANNMSLQYYARRFLLDIHQRRKVLEEFFRENGIKLPNGAQLRERAYSTLAGEIIGCASAAFNDEDHRLTQELESTALEMWPPVRKTWAWRKLQAKRRIGGRAWRFLRGAIALSGRGSRLESAKAMPVQVE